MDHSQIESPFAQRIEIPIRDYSTSNTSNRLNQMYGARPLAFYVDAVCIKAQKTARF